MDYKIPLVWDFFSKTEAGSKGFPLKERKYILSLTCHGLTYKKQKVYLRRLNSRIVFALTFGGLPGGLVVKNLPANSGDMNLIPNL